MAKQYENVKAKLCLWCERKMHHKGVDGRVGDKICEGCRKELINIKKEIGREKWYELIKRNGIDKEDVFNSYKDYNI